MLKAVIFDMDGVLLDSFNAWFNLTNDSLKHFGLKTVSKGKFRKEFWGIPITKSFKRLGIGEKELLDCILENKRTEAFARNIEIFEGSLLTLEKLHKKYKLAIATNTNRKLAEVMLEHADMLNYFDAVITFEDIKKPKPHPDVVLRACRLLKINPKEAAFVGDLQVDMKAGRAAGVRTVAVKPVKGADYVIAGVKNLPALLEKISSKKKNGK